MSDWGPGCVFTGVHAWDWLAPSVIPDGSRATEKAGAVTATHGGLANVLMVDGHVKSMRPEATDPNPSGHPDENMWDASR